MRTSKKPADAREKELELALIRIQKGRSKLGESKVSISAVAREAGVSTALIHNHYPRIAEAIRGAQGRSSRAQRDEKQAELKLERDKNRLLREEKLDLALKVSRLASLNEVLLQENLILRASLGTPNVVHLGSKKGKNS